MQGQGPILLNKLFSERQLVSCVVISLDVSNAKENKKKSKRIGLSLRLGDLHNGLTIDSIHEGLVSVLVVKKKDVISCLNC